MNEAGAGARLVTLDGLRGLAVMGILLMNVNAFAMPFAAYDDPAAFGPMRWPDVALWATEFVLIDGKLRAIFSALFGASLLLVADRAEAAGRSAARLSYARLLTLALFGLLHAWLLWAGDILVLYALVGLVAVPLRRLPVERLLVLAAMLFLFQAAILGLHYQALAAAGAVALAPDAPAAAQALWRQINDALGHPSPAALAADIALHRGPWVRLAASRAADLLGLEQTDLLFSGPETLGLMLLGMAGLRSGFLAGSWSSAQYRRWALRFYALGLPPLLVLAGLLVGWRFPPLTTAFLTDLGAMPGRWLVAIAHAALLVGWLTGPLSRLKARVVAAGRMAFSNYLGTSLLMTALFDGWGLGLYGRLERWWLLGPTLAMWLLMLGWSAPWLACFHHGPLEWAWRSLARARPAPFRRGAIARRYQSH